MFDNLTDRLTGTIKRLRGRARLSEDNIKDALREVRMALLEADVALPVVKSFIERVKIQAVGHEVLNALEPGQALIKVVETELIETMGHVADPIDLKCQPPAVILLAGLQGAGKTTSAAKLAHWLKERLQKKVMLVSCDIYRPAAIDQLETLSGQVGAEFFPSNVNQKPVDIAKSAVSAAKKSFCDVVIIDTAGRLHIDDKMMAEIRQVHQSVLPIETLFVVDSMLGQDAAITAKAFSDVLPLTGVILTKTDGDARGGAALSVRQVTGKPIKFIGGGEKIDALEVFHPDRIASRILGMGDVLSLVEEVQRKVDTKKAEKLAKKVGRGKRFDLEDFRDQLTQMQDMGGVKSLMDKMPGMGEIPDAAKDKINDKSHHEMVAIICSMTPQERKFPDVIRGSRKRRIANGSGTQIQDINRLLKQFKQMQKMMGKLSKKGGMARMMKGLQAKMSATKSQPLQ